MCGFTTEYSLNTLISKPEFIGLLNLSQKRGPDSQGYWSDGTSVQLGFNRLAIQDLSVAGQQPMQSPQKRFTIVFNGEIYNQLALRKKLQYTSFRGSSDTETITACLEEWGIEKTVSLLDGMFAMSIFDAKEKTVTLARDFAGIKPLFYGFKNGTLFASSQYDQIRAHPMFEKADLDLSVLKLYLQQHFMPAPFGLYKDTYQVLPGEMITFYPDGTKKHTRYWEFPAENDFSVFDKKEAQNLVTTTLDSCVHDQMLSDVPLGAFLSGGVDSPLICSFAKDYHKELQVFSIGSDSKIHDESERAKLFAEALEIKQHIWQLSAKEVLGSWDEAMKALHEPLADFSILPTYLVSKLAKQNVTVALSGDGGDELFFGYERFWNIGKNINYQHYPSIAKKAIYGFDKYVAKTRKVNSNLLADAFSDVHQGLHSRFRGNWLPLIAPDLKDVALPEWDVYNYENTRDERTLLRRLQKAEFYGMMQKTLRKVDLASMENSLEVRVPFLQKKMIEASLKIDPMLSYGNGVQKQLLKNILSSRVPQIPKEQIKKGFSVPLSKWIREDLQPVFQTTLLEGDLVKFGFDKQEVERMLTTHLKGEQDLKWALFTLYSLLK